VTEMAPEEYLAEIEEELPARPPSRALRLKIGAIIKGFELYVFDH
jgi:hypothetical protein